MVLHHVATGEGPTCLVVHGGPGLDHHYMRGLDALVLPLRLVYVDLPGHGASAPVPPEEFTLGRCAEELDGVRAALGEERVLVLAHSFGPSVALEYALRHPDRVAGLVLVAPTFGLDMDAVRRRAEARSPALAARFFGWYDGSAEGFRAWMEDVMPLYVHHADPDAAKAMLAGTVYRPEHHSGRLIGADDLRGRARGVACPTLVVTGREDFITPPADGEEVARAIPGAGLVLVPGCGHMVWAEAPAAFRAAVEGFLATARPAPPPRTRARAA